MNSGGRVAYKRIPHVNGGLFATVNVPRLTADEIGLLDETATLDWSSIEPAIFGTLFERSLDPAKRSQLGAHYTGRADIERVVEPVVMAPLRRRWDGVRAEATALLEKRKGTSFTPARGGRSTDSSTDSWRRSAPCACWTRRAAAATFSTWR